VAPVINYSVSTAFPKQKMWLINVPIAAVNRSMLLKYLSLQFPSTVHLAVFVKYQSTHYPNLLVTSPSVSLLQKRSFFVRDSSRNINAPNHIIYSSTLANLQKWFLLSVRSVKNKNFAVQFVVYAIKNTVWNAECHLAQNQPVQLDIPLPWYRERMYSTFVISVD